MSVDKYKAATAEFTGLEITDLDYINENEVRMLSMALFEATDTDVDGERSDNEWGAYCNSIVLDPEPDGDIYYRRAPKTQPDRGCGHERYVLPKDMVKFIQRVEDCPNGRAQFIISNYEVKAS